MKATKKMFLWILAASMALFSAGVKVEAETYNNPIIETDDLMSAKQRVTWDCVWFGGYPQTEIVEFGSEEEAALKELNTYYETYYESVDSETFEKIKNASYNSDGDAVIDGKKYRRIMGKDVPGRNDYFNNQDLNRYHYFKYEPIKWRILSVNDGQILLLADKILDYRQYHTKYETVHWETSTIRSWLNGYGKSSNQNEENYQSKNFITDAFSATEQKIIQEKTIKNADTLIDGSIEKNDTTDKIFLLSETEMWGEDAVKYGFVNDEKIYDEARRSKTSTYAFALGAYRNTYELYAGNCTWWLRSMVNDNNADTIRATGESHDYDFDVVNDNNGIRPALYVDLSASDVFFDAGTVCSDGIIEEYDPPKKEYEEENSEDIMDSEETTAESDSDNETMLPDKNINISTNDSKKETVVGDSVGNLFIKADAVTLSGISNKIAAGKKVQLTVTFTPSNVSNKNVIWTSSNPKVATVNQNGVVTFKKKSAGKSVIITATVADGSGAKAAFKLKSMKGVVKKVAISGAKKRTVKAGKTLKLKAKVTATKGSNKKLLWTSSNTKYATVSASGKVKTKKAGKGKTVKITVMATDGSGKKQVVKVKIK